MTKRIGAIALIFICTSIAWIILGGTIFSRTYSLNEISQDRVASTWGAPQDQSPPVASFKKLVTRKEESLENGRKSERIRKTNARYCPLKDGGDVALDMEPGRSCLYSTYKCLRRRL